LYQQAAQRFGIDFGASWWIGDRYRDIEPATKLGGHGILVRTGKGQSEAAAGTRTGYPVADGVNGAVDLILGAVG
jgi:histidinol phosphatase-like enzyme